MALVAAVIYLSLTDTFLDYLQIENDLKPGHIIAYAILMFYFAQLIINSRIGWFIAGFFVLMGIVLEYLQGMSGYRTFSYYDMFANCMGVSIGFIVSKTPLVNTLEHIDRKIAGYF
ncbi:MAG: VanZ family protein [Nitrospirae bacterium]|nr:VanZ family protein [Nitrospirota bacterium]